MSSTNKEPVPFHGVATPHSIVKVYTRGDGLLRATVTADANGFYSGSVAGLPEGTFQFYAVATTPGHIQSAPSATTALLVDRTAPVVTAFVMPLSSMTWTIPITTLTVTDPAGGTSYLITQSATPPSVTDPGWSLIQPTSYTVSADGSYTLYAWALDAVGNISPPFAGQTVTVATSALDPRTQSGAFSAPAVTGLGPFIDCGFTPTAVILFGGSQTADGLAAVTAAGAAIGVADGTNQGVVSVSADSGMGAAQTSEHWASSGYIRTTGAGVVQVAATVQIVPGGFRLNYSATTSGIRISYLALGGGIQAKVGSVSGRTTGTGTLAVTGIGFQPKAVVLLAAPLAVEGQVAGWEASYGIADGVLQNVLGGYADASLAAKRFWNNGALLALGHSGASPTQSASLQSFDADGFTLSYTANNDAPHTLLYLALGGPSISTAVIVQRTTGVTGANQDAALPFVPLAALFLNNFGVQSPTYGAHAEVQVGATDSARQRSATAYDVDGSGAANSNCWAGSVAKDVGGGVADFSADLVSLPGTLRLHQNVGFVADVASLAIGSNLALPTGNALALFLERRSTALCATPIPTASGTFVACVSSAYPKYPGTYIEDVWFTAIADPVHWTAARIREIVDAFGSYIGLDPINTAMPPFNIYGVGGFGDNPDGSGVRGAGSGYYSWRFEGYAPALDTAAFFVLLMCRADALGDATVYATWKAPALAALASVPRTVAGSAYIDPALLSALYNRPTIGSMYQDNALNLTGFDALVTAQTAEAYQALRAAALLHSDAATVAACEANIASLINGLAVDARIVGGTFDGFFNAGGTELHPNTFATALALACGLFRNNGEATSTSNALIAAYLGTAPFAANAITASGGVRLLAAPHYWTTTNAAPDTYRNGGYETLWAVYLARAFEAAGRLDLANQVAAEAVAEINHAHVLEPYSSPWEWHSASGARGIAPPSYTSATNFPSGGAILAWLYGR